MAKVYGRTCGILIVVLFCVFNFELCDALNKKNDLNEFDFYDTSASFLPHINDVELSDSLKWRYRRDAPADTKNPVISGAVTAGSSSVSGAAAGTVSATSAHNDTLSAAGGIVTDGSAGVSYNVHNVGVNGTGQRKEGLTAPTQANQQQTQQSQQQTDTTLSVSASDGKKPALTNTQYPKKVAQISTPIQKQQPQPQPQTPTATGTTTTEISVIDAVDVSDEKTVSESRKCNLTAVVDHHIYYNSTSIINAEETARIWNEVKNFSLNAMLSQSHRRAMTVVLSFDFPFYGHYVRNITVATGGFLYTGEYVHSWLAATQYIAPLMANFDTTLLNDSLVRLNDNGTAFTVVWENVILQDKQSYGKFTFSTTLHKNGDIVFVYYKVPISINTIEDHQHPVKVGLSDAYIIDKYYYFSRRKTIYEYHRVTFKHSEITNSSIIYLTALPTCLAYTDCVACVNHNTSFDCNWCPSLNRCSTGTDRKKQEWQSKGCDQAQINVSSSCPALGTQGNNAADSNTEGNDKNSGDTTQLPNNSNPGNNQGGGSTATSTTTTDTKVNGNGTAVSPADLAGQVHKLAHNADQADGAANGDNKNVGVAFGFMVPICMVFAVTLWLFYAYRNPHTRSGQLLIQFRPSQWSWRRGEARYTAATIHM